MFKELCRRKALDIVIGRHKKIQDGVHKRFCKAAGRSKDYITSRVLYQSYVAEMDDIERRMRWLKDEPVRAYLYLSSWEVKKIEAEVRKEMGEKRFTQQY